MSSPIDPDCLPALHDAAGLRTTAAPRTLATPVGRFAGWGLFDLQVNGFAGVDYNTPDTPPEAIEASLRAMLATGVTGCLPTVITADEGWQARCFRTLERAREASPLVRAMVPGYHLEGPFLNPEPGYSGCHPAGDMRDGDVDHFERLQEAAGGRIRLVTVAPERPGVLDLVRRLAAAGVTVAIGHSAADLATLERAVDAGATLSTHLGNGVASTVAKSDNTLLAQLSLDALAASFIADGVHLRRHVLKVYLRAKGAERTLLVTDGTAGCAAAPGRYRLGKLAIERRRETRVTLPDSESLAGSAITLDACLRNVVRWYGVPVARALEWASTGPRRAIGLAPEPLAGEPLAWVEWRADETGPTVSRAQLGQERVEPAQPSTRPTDR